MFNKSVFIFRRDLRLYDNTGLIEACNQSKVVIPIFILDTRQIGSKNKYRSLPALQFMLDSLNDLNTQLKKQKGKLYLFSGIAEKVIEKLIKAEDIDAVFTNRDYTPFSINRDAEIKKICLKQNVAFISCNDLLLHEPENITTASGTPYTIFTPFFKKSSKLPVKSPQALKKPNWYVKPIALQIDHSILKKLSSKKLQLFLPGKRSAALSIFKNLKNFKNYHKERNYPSIPTTELSAYLKFGLCSIREAYWTIVEKLGKNHELIKQLHWRDFFTHVAYYSPFVFGHAYKDKYNKLPWQNNKEKFSAWCEGKTGFPIVDAGMRQLNQTGFMHNRVRMITASFLIKDLHIDWRWGERYFAQNLIDYDPSVNNGNWQWSASTGCDAQPYFRIFNPWLQQKKFDPNAIYIKTWIPELKNESTSSIHNWYKKQTTEQYPTPIVNHDIESKKAKAIYKKM